MFGCKVTIINYYIKVCTQSNTMDNNAHVVPQSKMFWILIRRTSIFFFPLFLTKSIGFSFKNKPKIVNCMKNHKICHLSNILHSLLNHKIKSYCNFVPYLSYYINFLSLFFSFYDGVHYHINEKLTNWFKMPNCFLCNKVKNLKIEKVENPTAVGSCRVVVWHEFCSPRLRKRSSSDC